MSSGMLVWAAGRDDAVKVVCEVFGVGPEQVAQVKEDALEFHGEFVDLEYMTTDLPAYA